MFSTSQQAENVNLSSFLRITSPNSIFLECLPHDTTRRQYTVITIGNVRHIPLYDDSYPARVRCIDERGNTQLCGRGGDQLKKNVFAASRPPRSDRVDCYRRGAEAPGKTKRNRNVSFFFFLFYFLFCSRRTWTNKRRISKNTSRFLRHTRLVRREYNHSNR